MALSTTYRMFTTTEAVWEALLEDLMRHFEVCSVRRLSDYVDPQGVLTETMRYDSDEELYYTSYESGEQPFDDLVNNHAVNRMEVEPDVAA